MTTQAPPPPGSAEPSAARSPSRFLRRPAAGRVIGGVAAGIADYLNIDPLLVRAAFVGLMIFGGAGLVLYVGAWLLVPAEGEDHSAVEAALRRVGLAPRRVVALLVFIAAGIVLISWLGRPVGYDLGTGLPTSGTSDGQVVLVVVMVFVGLLLLRRGAGGTAIAPSNEVASYVAAAPVTGGSAGTPKEIQAAVTPAPSSPLAWYVAAAALIAVGVLALIGNVAPVRVLPGQFFGATLGMVGIGLVVGSWWGRGRRLIVPALFLLPFAFTAAFVTAPIEGGTGDLRYAPTSASELRGSYRLIGGRLVLDLRQLQVSEPVHLAASVAIGQLVVIVPSSGRLEVDASVGAGASEILGSVQNGTAVTDRYVRGSGSQRFVLDLQAGIGEIRVETED